VRARARLAGREAVPFAALNEILAVFTPISLRHSAKRNSALPHSRVYRAAGGRRARKEIYGREAAPAAAAAVD